MSNDAKQADIGDALSQKHGIKYERKRNQFTGLTTLERNSVVNNERAGQAYLAIFGPRPTTARTQKYKIWDQYYDDAFPTTNISAFYAAFLIHEYCIRKRSEYLGISSNDTTRYSVANYGSYHIARALAFYWTGRDHWSESQAESLIQELKGDLSPLEQAYEIAFSTVIKIIQDNTDYSDDVDNAFKRNEIDRTLSRRIHDKRRGKPVRTISNS